MCAEIIVIVLATCGPRVNHVYTPTCSDHPDIATVIPKQHPEIN